MSATTRSRNATTENNPLTIARGLLSVVAFLTLIGRAVRQHFEVLRENRW